MLCASILWGNSAKGVDSVESVDSAEEGYLAKILLSWKRRRQQNLYLELMKVLAFLGHNVKGICPHDL